MAQMELQRVFGSMEHLVPILVFTDWYPSEPNNLNGDQDCAAITRSADFRWDDLSCTALIYYICKKSAMIIC
ncbi:hypothetical protein KUTeg_010204 [Tegillarca granosa]|uniref:C-type lectin domain-containing protein n=1 Tax=Tegillarca granosa TaxID=220873 RepID=A0ABQ9F625_TEGGR|nr:hypothetical protein KUTeg_010204 [Tegillarca granosa]